MRRIGECGRTMDITMEDSPRIFQCIRRSKAEQKALGFVSPFLKIGVSIQVSILIISLAVYRFFVFSIFSRHDSHLGNVISIFSFFALLSCFALWQAGKSRRELVNIYYDQGVIKKQEIIEISLSGMGYLVFALVAGSLCFLLRFSFLFLQF